MPSKAAVGGTTWFSDTDLAITITVDTNGVRTTFSTADTPITFQIDTIGKHTGIGSTIGRNLNFDIFTNGVRTRFGTLDTPIVFAVDTQGARQTYGVVDLGITAGIDTIGTLYKRGSVDMPVTFTVTTKKGKLGAKSTADTPLLLNIDTTGTGGSVIASNEALKVDEEPLPREPWPAVPKSPRPGYRPFKPGYMRKKNA